MVNLTHNLIGFADLATLVLVALSFDILLFISCASEDVYDLKCFVESRVNLLVRLTQNTFH